MLLRFAVLLRLEGRLPRLRAEFFREHEEEARLSPGVVPRRRRSRRRSRRGRRRAGWRRADRTMARMASWQRYDDSAAGPSTVLTTMVISMRGRRLSDLRQILMRWGVTAHLPENPTARASATKQLVGASVHRAVSLRPKCGCLLKMPGSSSVLQAASCFAKLAVRDQS